MSPVSVLDVPGRTERETRSAGEGRLALMPAIEANPALAFGDRIVRELQRRFAMAAFVAVGVLQLRAGQLQVIERRLHARLIGAGAAGDESRGDGSEDEKGNDETMKFHGSP